MISYGAPAWVGRAGGLWSWRISAAVEEVDARLVSAADYAVEKLEYSPSNTCAEPTVSP